MNPLVKSNTGSLGSIARSPEDIDMILQEVKKYRGDVEGGTCLWKVTRFVPDTERRYFVVNQMPYGPDDSEIPAIVHEIAQRIKSPFYSVDVAQLESNKEWILIELGDGEVSDKKQWPLDSFVEALLR